MIIFTVSTVLMGGGGGCRKSVHVISQGYMYMTNGYSVHCTNKTKSKDILVQLAYYMYHHSICSYFRLKKVRSVMRHENSISVHPFSLNMLFTVLYKTYI